MSENTSPAPTETTTDKVNAFFWDAEKKQTVYVVCEASTEKPIPCYVICPVNTPRKLVIIPTVQFVEPRFTPTDWTPPVQAGASAPAV
ncbi:hypothetical protein GCM10028806_33350 [Spirosoma terrae]|uniref:Uncharacterized protein n=1 Tax=Spirosoma terrae TaxID=1968276 RepID=A0A6L9L5I0_9BACT|nr:hypothetical protein [Spirosoma terrae]NDU95650.1 hypothetical protein [Spirosoma terrae]